MYHANALRGRHSNSYHQYDEHTQTHRHHIYYLDLARHSHCLLTSHKGSNSTSPPSFPFFPLRP